MTIAIDFDGTVVTHEYPNIGRPIGAALVLKDLVKKGHQLILFTMRSGEKLDAAVAWFDQNGVDLYGIQYNPTQNTWTKSNKCYAELYIDDAALGIPLIQEGFVDGNTFKFTPRSIGDSIIKVGRPYVDWTEVEILLKERKIL